MAVDTTKGWFVVPGHRERGDRTLKEQMLGVSPALEESRGRTVLDLGCAEGLISLEFAKAGAARVLGVEALDYHLEVARQVCAGWPVEFACGKLEDIMETPEARAWRFDVVLALAIVHKLRDVEAGLRFAARACSDLLVFRGPSHMTPAGDVKSKRWDSSCNVNAVMKGSGFVLEYSGLGPRGEPVQRWRRR